MRVALVSVLFLACVSASADVLDDYLKIEDADESQVGLSESDRSRLYYRVANHPVASLAMVDKYDTPNREIGFCFGRAMAAHLIARKMGLRDSSIKKLFIVGDLRGADGSIWRFHVTTLVRDKAKSTWYAIDPIMGRPLTVEQWIAAVTGGWDSRRKAYLYQVPSYAIAPDIRVVPDPADESGERLIELAFRPEDRNGFEVKEVGNRKVYVADKSTTEALFLVARAELDTTFDFLSVTINGTHYPYKGYFVDLLTDLLKPNFREPQLMVRALNEAVPFKPKGNDLRGFKVPRSN